MGGDAKKYFRSSERRFPLVYRGKHFSVSHSGAITVLAVADVPIGVDVEQGLTQVACADLAWAWSECESLELLRRFGDGRLATEIWTAKEAASKACGVGLRAMPATIATSGSPLAPSHRTILVPSNFGGDVYLDSHGVWWGESHVRVAWILEY
ncbi:MAG: hypothetical protein DI613_12700 [Kocuria rhizophila]|nr:MAG: hypothetical protein DI613_12700 [Kocuria rhizophila]